MRICYVEMVRGKKPRVKAIAEARNRCGPVARRHGEYRFLAAVNCFLKPCTICAAQVLNASYFVNMV